MTVPIKTFARSTPNGTLEEANVTTKSSPAVLLHMWEFGCPLFVKHITSDLSHLDQAEAVRLCIKISYLELQHHVRSTNCPTPHCPVKKDNNTRDVTDAANILLGLRTKR